MADTPGPAEALVRTADVRTDGGTQSRAGLDEATVEEYAALYREALSRGDRTPCDALPPLACCFDGSHHWPYDGFHRYHGLCRAGVETARVRHVPGTAADARWLACAANKSHGLKRNNRDKRHAVEMALAISPALSDRALADWCGVSDFLVRQVRESRTCREPPPAGRRKGRDSKTYPAAPARQERLLDALGNEVPPHLRDVFGDGRVAQQLARVRAWRAAVERDSVLRRLGPVTAAHRYLSLSTLGNRLELACDYLDAAAVCLEDGLPYALCPRCAGAEGGCEHCRAQGYVPKFRFEELGEQARLEGKEGRK